MTRAISTRIARLEKKAGMNARPLPLFFIIFVTPGPPQEAVRAESYGGEQSWTRLPDETEDAFKARITGDLPPPTAKRGGIVLLFPEDRDFRPESGDGIENVPVLAAARLYANGDGGEAQPGCVVADDQQYPHGRPVWHRPEA